MMKRLGLLVVALGMLTACHAPSSEPEPTAAGEPSAWLRPPLVTAVSRNAGAAIVSGLAGSGARVVLRAESGAAFAAAADNEGRFVVRVAAARGGLILTPEVQNGQEAAASPDRLLLLSAGPAALLRPGGATQRLDVTTRGLDVIDTDGRALMASGRISARQSPRITAGGRTQVAEVGLQGRWSVMLPPGTTSVIVDGETYAVPVLKGEGVFEIGEGWLIGWRTSDGAVQHSWLPN